MTSQDTFGQVYEKLQDKTTKQKLSALQEQIKTEVWSQWLGTDALDKVGDALLSGEQVDKKAFSLDLDVLTLSASLLYKDRLSKDIILKYLSWDTPWKNQSLDWRGQLKNKFIDKMVNTFAKQENAYDTILAKIETPIVQKFQAELDELKQLVVLPDPNAPATNDAAPETNDQLAKKVPIGLPIAGMKKTDISSDLGHRTAPKEGATEEHAGIDVSVQENTPVLAAADGEIMTVANQPDGAGNYIEIDHGDYITRYFHLNTQDVKAWDKITQGTVIGKSGATGNVTGPHLHYEIRDKKDIVDSNKTTASKYKILDPEKYLDFDGDGQVVALHTEEVEQTDPA